VGATERVYYASHRVQEKAKSRRRGPIFQFNGGGANPRGAGRPSKGGGQLNPNDVDQNSSTPSFEKKERDVALVKSYSREKKELYSHL